MKKLKALREKAKKTQTMMASILGISQQAYANYELGNRQPDPQMLSKMADYFNVSIDYLLEREEIDSGFEHIPNIFQIETRKIPLLGDIAAGQPLLADEKFECYIEAGSSIRADFCLRVKGDSMINARIQDGDIVFIRKQNDVNDGEIAAVLIDDEATLKRVYKNNGSITLWAENPAYRPIIITEGDCKNVRILGKAIAYQSDIR